ncbi:hypothetical protein SSP24_04230 [Streptomyces spinoverrucosus]|uniref:HTH cro/C1-type domain-containing protein n=1 Tax=Streptomyces spinoverrucosus TaxID=284043 RepID=A0A4Y3V9J4_9ACTN|nr:hypothetical protein SSP24_04230 [Streptomyces spinoverrucosus]GHB40615.1 hypothetical protein GCM10010397_08370 [Streptomyces spinoverrucosus]
MRLAGDGIHTPGRGTAPRGGRQLAAIGVDYYTRLEQGRVRASTPVLTTLARALHLNEDQQRYLYELAGRSDDRPRRRRPAQRVRPAMRRLSTNSPTPPPWCSASAWTSSPGTPPPPSSTPTSPSRQPGATICA